MLVGAIVFFYVCEQGISEQYWCYYVDLSTCELSMAGSFPLFGISC